MTIISTRNNDLKTIVLEEIEIMTVASAPKIHNDIVNKNSMIHFLKYFLGLIDIN